MKRILSGLLAVLLAAPAQAAGPLIWSGGGQAKGLNTGGITLGSGQTINNDGPENWIKNAGAEDPTITGLSTYDDGASATPVDCTGGSPATVSTTVNTTSPIKGVADYAFAKSAADGQGEGWAFTVTLPANNPAAVAGWQAAFDAMIRTSANYVASDMGVYVYDVTNATTPVLVTNIAASTQTYTGPWPWSSSGSSASYRVCFHVQTTSALAYTLNVDNIYAGIEKAQPVPAEPRTPWVAVSPVSGAFTNLTSSARNFVWRQNGSSIEVSGDVTFSSVPTGSLRIDLTTFLPSGLTVDASRFGTSTVARPAGEWVFFDASAASSANDFQGTVLYTGSTAEIRFVTDDDDEFDATSPVAGAVGDILSFEFSIPITQWADPSYSANAGNCEYAYSGEAWTATGTTTVFGENGQAMSGALGGSVAKTINWTRPAKFVKVLGSYDRISWTEMNEAALDASFVIPGLTAAGTVFSGAYSRGGASATQSVVTFGRYMNFANDDSPATEWPSSNAYWVVENCPTAAGSITFAMATEGRAGLVEPYNTSAGSVYSGRYTPTVTDGGGATTATPTAQSCHYSRVGSTVTVSGRFSTTTSAGSGAVVVDVTLPNASDFTASDDAVGVANSNLADTSGRVTADTASNVANVQFTSVTTSNRSVYFTFSYEIK